MRRRGFTFTETVVAAGLTAAMAAIVLPSISYSVQSWRSIQCTNNLRQLVAGLNAYHDIHNNYPPSMEGPAGALSGISRPNWMIRILPHIGEEQLFASIDFTKSMLHSGTISPTNWPDANANVTATDLPLLHCPADSRHDVKYRTRVGFNKKIPGNENGLVFQYFARGNYAANACQSFNFWYAPGSAANASRCGGPDQPEWLGGLGAPYPGMVKGALPLRGVMGNRVSMPRPQITDGLTNTIILSEVNVGLAAIDFRGCWAMGDPAASSLWQHVYGPNANFDLIGTSCQGPSELYSILGNGDVNLGRQIAIADRMACSVDDGARSGGNPKSRHDGGIFVAMCDGSVRFVKDSIQRGTHPPYWTGTPSEGALGAWERLNMSADGQFVDPNAEGVLEFHLGDMDGDGDLDNFDIVPFELALTNPNAYLEQYMLFDYPQRGDCNGDGEFNNHDIRAFEDLLTRRR